MKINPVNIFNFNIPQYNKKHNSAKDIQNQQFDYSMAESQHSNKYSKNSFALDEALGRSQVNFTGIKNQDDKYQEYDKMFIDTVSQNLRLSDEDKQILTNNIKTFLNTNGFKSLEAIAGNKNQALQADFIFELRADICYSDFDYDILMNAFQDRMYYSKEYVPKVDLYEKDFEVVSDMLGKYGMDEGIQAEIFDVLKMHADSSDAETVFDLFKPENKPNGLMNLIKNQLRLDDNLAIDLLIDFVLMAKKDDEARHEGIYPWKKTALMNAQVEDEAIANEIIGKYCSKVDNNSNLKVQNIRKEIVEQLNRRRSGVSVEQISYELMEKYNLSSEAYKFIKNTILEYDAVEFTEN